MNRFPFFRFIPFFICLLTLNPFGLQAQEETLIPEKIELNKKNWTVGICRLVVSNLDDRYDYLSDSLPQLLKEEFRDISRHNLSFEEKDFLTASYVDEQVKLVKNAIDTLYTHRDELLFSDSTDEQKAESYNDYSESIQKKMQEQEAWERLDTDLIEIEDELAVEYQDFDVSPNARQTPRFMEQKNLDMLLTGKLERLDELFFLELSCYNRIKKDPVYSWSGIGREEELNSIIRKAAREMRIELLGRTWAELYVQADPPGSIVYLDGEIIGVGNAVTKTASPGYATLTVSESGYSSHSQQIYLPGMGRVEKDIQLEKEDIEKMYFFSDPPGADVYFGSQWMGYTPLEVPKPEFSNDVKISMDKYESFHTPSWELEGNSITVELSKGRYDRQQAFDEAKSRFYRSLGWFSLSMGAPLIIYGIYQNQYNMYYNYALDWQTTGSQSSYEKAIDAQEASEFSYNCFLGGVAVSGALLINTLCKLNSYIRAAEESTAD